MDDLLAIARDRSADALLRAAAILNIGFRKSDERVSEIASTLETLARAADDEASCAALISLALLDREGRATARLAEQMRERGIAPLADLAEQVATVIGDEQAFALMLCAGEILGEAPPVDAAASDQEAEFVRMRRKATEDVFLMLLRAPLPIPLPLLLSAATSLATEPEVRTIARACAFAAIAGDRSRDAIIAMLRDPGTEPLTREVLAWSLRGGVPSSQARDTGAGDTGAGETSPTDAAVSALDAVARDDATPSTCAGRGNREPADSRTRGGGRRSASPRWRRHIAASTDAALDVRDRDGAGAPVPRKGGLGIGLSGPRPDPHPRLCQPRRRRRQPIAPTARRRASRAP